MTATTGRLLLRDLAQLATPAAPALRCAARRSAGQVLENAFVLCDGDAIEAVGRMSTLRALEDDVVELDCRGLCAVPGLVDCHTHAAFGGDRVDEFSLRAGGASYEELHAAGGGILSTVRATRAAGRPASSPRSSCTARGCSREGTTTLEAKSGYGLDRETSSPRFGRSGGRRHPNVAGAHAIPPESADADAYLDFALAEVLLEAAGLAEAADVFLERGASEQPRRGGTSRRAATQASAAAPRRPAPRSPVRSHSPSSSAPLRRPP